MPKIDIENLTDEQKVELIKNRWDSSDTIWDIIDRVYKRNTKIYSNKADWLDNIVYKRKPWTVQANRIFTNMEAVINSLIANPAGINVLPGRDGVEAQNLASTLESYFKKKFEDINFKEITRMALRNLYFSRLLVIKPYWDSEINDFCFRAVDSTKVRFGRKK